MLKLGFFPLECSELIESIGLIVKEKRLDTRLRQSDLAERVGISVSTVRKIEAGERGVEVGTLLHVLWQLGALSEVMALDRSCAQTSGRPPRRVRLPAVSKEDF